MVSTILETWRRLFFTILQYIQTWLIFLHLMSKLQISPRSRDDDDHVAGCSNSPVKIHLEMVDKIQVTLNTGMPVSLTTTKDELYMHISSRMLNEYINVYDRNNLPEVKDVILIENLGVMPLTMAACGLSNCLYVLSKGESWDSNRIVRITKDDQDQFNISPWIDGLPPQKEFLSVTAAGSLIILSEKGAPNQLISIYNSDGSLQHQIRLSLDLFQISTIIPKSSGNIVLISYDYEFKTKLTEINMDGTIVRQYQSSLRGCDVASADSCDKVLIVYRNSKMELLDSELQLLDATFPDVSDDLWAHPRSLHYDRLKNEALMIDYTGRFRGNFTVSIFSVRKVE